MNPNPESKPQGSEQPRKVCLCGSSKWPMIHHRVMMDETLAGRIVIPMGLYGHADYPTGAKKATNDGDESTEVKQMLDRLHYAKIDASDEILVVRVNGYIGSSTRREIEHATSTGKPVRYFDTAEPLPNPSADEEVETPLVDAAFAEYPVMDTQRGGDAITIQAARAIEKQLRQQHNAEREAWKSEKVFADNTIAELRKENTRIQSELATAQKTIEENESKYKSLSFRFDENLKQGLEIEAQLVAAQTRLKTAMEERDQWGKELGEAKGAIDTLERLLKGAEEERDAARAKLNSDQFMDQWGWMQKCKNLAMFVARLCSKDSGGSEQLKKHALKYLTDYDLMPSPLRDGLSTSRETENKT